jgi:hypothetical protein
LRHGEPPGARRGRSGLADPGSGCCRIKSARSR